MELKKKDLKQRIIENIDHRLKEEKNLLKRADLLLLKARMLQKREGASS